MPGFLQWIAPIWPSCQLCMLAFGAAGWEHAGSTLYVLVLVASTAIVLPLAALALRRHG